MPKRLNRYTMHRLKWSKCTGCDLCTQRHKVVLYRGKKIPVEVLFVGEAPGASEDTLGRAFVGPAGQLLDDMVEAAGMDLDDCGFTNLIGCIPKDDTGVKVKQPPKESIKACSNRLQEIVSLAKPNLIVQVGKLAEKHLPELLEGYDGYNTISIMHPAAILRMNVSQQGLAIQRCVIALEDAWETHIVPF